MGEPAETTPDDGGIGTLPANEAAPTMVDVRPKVAPQKAAREGDTASKTGAGSSSTSVITARETLLVQEIAQTRAFVRIAGSLAALVAIAVTFIGGDPLAKAILHVALLAVVVVCAWLAWDLRDEQNYSVGKVLGAAFVSIAAAYAAVYYFGVFGPAVVVIPFGLCFFSAGDSKFGTTAVWITCSVIELFLGVLVTSGALVDRGMIQANDVSPFAKLAIVTLIEAVFLATFVIMRASRAATLRAIEMHDEALGQIAQREALLREARHDLAAALKAGGYGRFTDRELGGFRLGMVIGRGAMGEVYEAEEIDGGRGAAVKVLHDHVLAQPEHVQRFFREAKLAAALDVPHVVRILKVADVDAALPWLAMERLTGTDLSDWLRDHRRMSMARLLTLIRQLGVGLDAARAAGIVHRDLKPRNVFLARQGDEEAWKILDFGVSKLVTDDATLTRDKIIGTPTYMAPEQVEGTAVTHRTDLFALGVIAYRALTGRPAFAGDTEGQILYKVVHGMPPAPSTVVTCPPEVDLVMAVALAKSSADRFDSAAELAEALEGAARGSLSSELSARAERVLLRHPWDS